MNSMPMVIFFKNIVDSAVIMMHHVCLDNEVVHDVTNNLCVAKKDFLEILVRTCKVRCRRNFFNRHCQSRLHRLVSISEEQRRTIKRLLLK